MLYMVYVVKCWFLRNECMQAACKRLGESHVQVCEWVIEWVMWVSRVAYECVKLNTNESRPSAIDLASRTCRYVNESCEWVIEWVMWVSRVAYEYVVLYTNESRPSAIDLASRTCRYVNASCQWVMWISHVNESCEFNILHINVSRPTQTSHVPLQTTGRVAHAGVRNESCFCICMHHVPYEWVRSHTNESCHVWMSHDSFCVLHVLICGGVGSVVCHVTYEWVTSHMHESRHVWTSHDIVCALQVLICGGVGSAVCHITYEWGMLHTNKSRPTWMSHVTYERVMTPFVRCKCWSVEALDPRCVISHMNEACHTRMSHVPHGRVTSHMNESCLHLCVARADLWRCRICGCHVTYEWVTSYMDESCHV